MPCTSIGGAASCNITMFGVLDHNFLMPFAGVQAFYKTTGFPRGYRVDSCGVVPPLTPGGIAVYELDGLFSYSGSGDLAQGLSLEASGAILSWSGTASLAALINMSASGSIFAWAGSAEMTGSASISATGQIFTWAGTAGLGGLVSIEANGAIFTWAGTAETHSLAHMETTESTGEMTEATISSAVWEYIIGASSAGDLLQGAGAAGDPWIADLSGYGSGTAGAQVRSLPNLGKIMALVG